MGGMKSKQPPYPNLPGGSLIPQNPIPWWLVGESTCIVETIIRKSSKSSTVIRFWLPLTPTIAPSTTLQHVGSPTHPLSVFPSKRGRIPAAAASKGGRKDGTFASGATTDLK